MSAPAKDLLTAKSGSMYECGRRVSGWIGLISEVHCPDKTAVHGEHVENLAVRKNIPLKALDELVHPDACPAFVILGHCKRFDMGIELAPLSSPVGADLFFSHDLAALRSPGPANVLRHQRQCTVDVPLVKRGIRLLDNGLGVFQ